jgi:hypothetical protein
MRGFAEDGYLPWAPSFNSVIRYMDDPALTPILMRLIEESAAPLAAVESTFAPDATGFSTCNYVRWFDHKYGKEQKRNVWLKAHVMVGPKTNIITAARVTDGDQNDSPMLPGLLDTTTKRFKAEEVFADKGYLSVDNATAIEAAGATPYIPLKNNSTGAGGHHGPSHTKEQLALWKKLFHYFQFRREEFLHHYHQRSNVESTFSAVKRKFGAALRSKTRVGQENELLAKLLCFNLSVLVHEMYELGIVPTFWPEETTPGGVILPFTTPSGSSREDTE